VSYIYIYCSLQIPTWDNFFYILVFGGALVWSTCGAVLFVCLQFDWTNKPLPGQAERDNHKDKVEEEHCKSHNFSHFPVEYENREED